MWFSTLMILAAAVMQLHYHPVFAEDYLEDFCTNPHGEIGLCKNLKSCEPLLQLIRQNGSRATDFIRQSICGFIGSDSLVCCTDPSESDYDYNEDNNNNNNNSNNHNDEDNNNNNNNSSNNNDESRNNNIKNETISIRNNNNNKNNTSNRYGPLLAPECGLPDPRRPVKAFIVGGVPAGLGDWPWIAALGYKDKRNPTKPLWLCGGGLISNRHVLTAAHCIHGRDDLFLVRLGEYDLDDDKDGVTPIDVVIEKSTIHPKYNPHNFTNDVGVLRLQQDVEFTTFIRPICLPITDEIKQKNIANAFPFVAGWGAFFFSGPRSTKLQQVQVPIVGQEECKDAFKKFKNVTIDHRVICGGFARGGKGACQGDSGGPVMLRYGSAYYAIAVISYGFKCATPDIPGVYSNTTSFLDFIVPLLN